jgi:2'-hydroxyisoflavone reductase
VVAGYAPRVRLLVLGGSVFVGQHIVLEATQRGHHITVFTRGRHLDNLPTSADSIVGDRRKDLSDLAKQRWDAVIDTSGYRPDDVRRSAAALRGAASHYAFISTLDVYPDHSIRGLDESTLVEASWDSELKSTIKDGYRLLKAACEQEVRNFFPSTHQIFRSGLIVGPGDPTGRFSYWPLRLDRGGEILVPAPRSAPLQFIDVRDHAAFVLDLVESGTCGTFNATSPPGANTFESLLTTCAALTRAPFTLTWVDEALLVEQLVRPWTELPLWPGHGDGRAGTMLVSTAKAQAVGLACRGVEKTVSDVLGWARSLNELPTYPGQLSPIRERLLLLIAHEEGYIAS